jgi:hypothetical protein
MTSRCSCLVSLLKCSMTLFACCQGAGDLGWLSPGRSSGGIILVRFHTRARLAKPISGTERQSCPKTVEVYPD